MEPESTADSGVHVVSKLSARREHAKLSLEVGHVIKLKVDKFNHY